jgi:hypothetical protein
VVASAGALACCGVKADEEDLRRGRVAHWVDRQEPPSRAAPGYVGGAFVTRLGMEAGYVSSSSTRRWDGSWPNWGMVEPDGSPADSLRPLPKCGFELFFAACHSPLAAGICGLGRGEGWVDGSL